MERSSGKEREAEWVPAEQGLMANRKTTDASASES